MKIKIQLLILVLTFSCQSIFSQCITLNSSVLTQTAYSGVSPNYTCSFSFTPNVTVANNTGRAITFTINGVAFCYSGTNLGTVQATTCASNGNPGAFSGNLPSFNFSAPCTNASAFVVTATQGGSPIACTVSGSTSAPTTINSDGTPLPIKLLKFNSISLRKTVLLNWLTEKELGFDKFELERANDAVSFERIGNIVSKGNGYYEFEDFDPKIGQNYYRLKMVDLDGSFNYSKIIAVDYLGEKELSVYPNPMENSNLIIKGLEKNERFEIFRANGKPVNFDFSDENIIIDNKALNSKEIVLLKTSLGRTTKIIVE